MTLSDLKRALIDIVPSLGPLGRWLRKVCHLDRRYGVRYGAGLEMTGFYTDRQAHGWATSKKLDSEKYLVFHYDPIDLRMVGADTKKHKESYRP